MKAHMVGLNVSTTPVGHCCQKMILLA